MTWYFLILLPFRKWRTAYTSLAQLYRFPFRYDHVFCMWQGNHAQLYIELSHNITKAYEALSNTRGCPQTYHSIIYILFLQLTKRYIAFIRSFCTTLISNNHITQVRSRIKIYAKIWELRELFWQITCYII